MEKPTDTPWNAFGGTHQRLLCSIPGPIIHHCIKMYYRVAREGNHNTAEGLAAAVLCLSEASFPGSAITLAIKSHPLEALAYGAYVLSSRTMQNREIAFVPD